MLGRSESLAELSVSLSMMGAGLGSASPCTSLGENMMEDLKGFLQQMGTTIELLCNRYDTAARTLQLSAVENPDVPTSVAMGTAAGSPTALKTPGEAPGHHSDEGKERQMQNWFPQGLNFGLDAESQGFENRQLRSFLEEMKTTIQAWAERHNMIVQAKNGSTRAGADIEVVEAAAAAACSPQHLDSVMGEIALGADGVSLTCSKGQDIVVIDLGEDEGCEVPESNHALQNHDENGDSTCFVQKQVENSLPQAAQGETELVQPEEGKENENSLPQAVQVQTDVTSFSLQQVAHQSPAQEVADKKEPPQELKVAFQSSLPIPQVEPAQNQSHGDTDVEIPTTMDSREDTSATAKVDVAVAPKVEQDEMEIRTPQGNSKSPVQEAADPPNDHDAPNDHDVGREIMLNPSRGRIDVVDSPEWLPKGWLTEVKTRDNGRKRDKYYFDPISNRRFRTKREVFCFLETGKLGRYKKRKLIPVENPAVQTCNSCQAKIANGGETTAMASVTVNTSGPSNAPSITAPIGIFSNVHMPFQPGQPSEWQFYESLTRFPFAVFDPFRYADFNERKSAYSRGPSSWPSQVDKNEPSKSVEKSKDGRSEALPKRAKKSVKKRATKV